MAVQPGQPRREWGSVKDPVRLGWRVELANKAYIDHLAAEADLSGAALFDLMVEHIRASNTGLPDWLPTKTKEAELPIE